jgi:hypothetical protein
MFRLIPACSRCEVAANSRQRWLLPVPDRPGTPFPSAVVFPKTDLRTHTQPRSPRPITSAPIAPIVSAALDSELRRLSSMERNSSEIVAATPVARKQSETHARTLEFMTCADWHSMGDQHSDAPHLLLTSRRMPHFTSSDITTK